MVRLSPEIKGIELGKPRRGELRIDGEIITTEIIISRKGEDLHFRAKEWFWEESDQKSLQIVLNFHIFKKLRISNVNQILYY